MAAAAIAMSAVGSAVQAFGQVSQGNAEFAAGQYNADMNQRAADQTRATAAEEERRLRIQSRKQLGDIRANYGASGVGLEGSALDVLEESASNAELDALTVRHAGETRARAFEAQANLERFRGRNARTAGYLGAATTLLKFGGGAAASYGGGK
ncbi:hypothetical protein E6Q11_02530 [Candidatus Dojkabacteria bacterium]|uniref:Uncharacterized protein n=1 Tax=Candidatus Dojkabacteria bacterium TaxID=2099670 RepID=A0A5C7J7R9_9BACT|nr:MAG: hypothetical protein E6Q11_02530 [Candidatus Dojkabacteria bacterium]